MCKISRAKLEYSKCNPKIFLNLLKYKYIVIRDELINTFKKYNTIKVTLLVRLYKIIFIFGQSS